MIIRLERTSDSNTERDKNEEYLISIFSSDCDVNRVRKFHMARGDNKTMGKFSAAIRMREALEMVLGCEFRIIQPFTNGICLWETTEPVALIGEKTLWGPQK